MRKNTSLGAALALALFVPASPAAADEVILDDLIVDGSACIGFDCVNGESFGFDTLKLKENNLRIKFEDTSTAASFPTNDWQITINDSANGGQSRYSIDDITGGRTPFTIRGGAPSHSLYVNTNGNIGLGTSTPALELSIKDGDTPSVRLEQDGSSGWAPQTWDVSGNETNFFIRDVTSGSRLPFRIRPGAPTNSIDIANDGNVGIGTASADARLHLKDDTLPAVRLEKGAAAQVWQMSGDDTEFAIADISNSETPFRILPGAPTSSLEITAGGDVGIGTATVDDRLHIAGASAVARFDNTSDTQEWRVGSAGSERFFISDATGSTFPVIIEETAPTDTLRMAASGNIGIGTAAPQARLHTVGTVRFAGLPSCASGIVSDASGNLSCLVSTRSLKHIGGSLSPDVALQNVMALKPMTGAYKATPDQPEHWLIAEEVAEVDPALVGLNKGEPYTVKLQGIVTDLIAVTQEQQRVIEEQERRFADQQRRLDALEKRLAAAGATGKTVH
jgi:hypothetical protein